VALVEGAKVLGEALRAGVPVESVYLDPAAGPTERELAERCGALGARVFGLDGGVLARVSDTVTPQPILAVVAAAGRELHRLSLDRQPGPPLVVVCAGVRDPGNAGTVVRCAEAVGAEAVISCDGSVDLFNPKTVRASAGTVFHLPVVNGGAPEEVLAELRGRGLALVGAVAHGGEDYLTAELGGPVALVLGNEAHGLAPAVAAATVSQVTIPLVGRAESLNVGTAAAVLCFEVARRRRPAVATSAGSA
jgi:TrmH family RNA methyltransferase